MRKIDKIVVGAFVLECLLFFGYRGYRAHHPRIPVETVQASSVAVIGPHTLCEGQSSAPYTLVEFGDYQCPPCAGAYADTQKILKKYHGKLKFTFRHYPLPMHQYAMDSALLAEQARSVGAYWQVHDALYGLHTHIDPEALDKLKHQFHLAAKRSDAEVERDRAAIEVDREEGNALKIPGTPSFFLCCPDNRVVKITSLDIVPELLN
ncbi:MAG: Protein-disulfide isomerase [Chthonomonadaceae bacterium]|nr:Protein-disulfide isomerase [Chthonomonadaceae bacterium]